MTESSSANGQNLTGVWHGMYSYPYGEPPTSFVATLIESGTLLTGTTHEAMSFTAVPQTLYATLSGSRSGSAVSFVKTCENGGRAYSKPIHYEGALSSDGTEIEGRWTIAGEWSGKFLMIRSAGKTEAVTRKEFQRA